MSAKFRYIGTTDDVVDCERPGCTQRGLKSTIIIMPLDVDGNDEGEPVYYGSTCAAQALAIRGGGRAVTQAANGARLQTLLNAHDARRMLRVYGLPEAGAIEEGMPMVLACRTYGDHNPGAMRAALSYSDMRGYLLDMLGRKQAAIRDAVLVAGEDWGNDRQPLDYGYGSVIRDTRS